MLLTQLQEAHKAEMLRKQRKTQSTKNLFGKEKCQKN